MYDDPTRSPSTVTRRAALAGLGVAGLGLAVGSAPRQAAAQDAADGQDLVGSWRVAVTNSAGMSFLTLSSFNADGTVLTSRLPAEQAPPGTPPGLIIISTAHGAWEATGADTANATFIHIRASGEGQPLGTVTVRLSTTLDADGDTFTGESAATVADPAGNVIATFTGTVQATRIVAEAPGTPVEATPTG